MMERRAVHDGAEGSPLVCVCNCFNSFILSPISTIFWDLYDHKRRKRIMCLQDGDGFCKKLNGYSFKLDSLNFQWFASWSIPDMPRKTLIFCISVLFESITTTSHNHCKAPVGSGWVLLQSERVTASASTEVTIDKNVTSISSSPLCHSAFGIRKKAHTPFMVQ